MSLRERLRRDTPEPLETWAPADEALSARLAAVELVLRPTLAADRREQWWHPPPSFTTTAAGMALADASDEQRRAAALWAHKQHLTWVQLAVRDEKARNDKAVQLERPVLEAIVLALARRKRGWTFHEAHTALTWTAQLRHARGWYVADRLRIPLAAADGAWAGATEAERDTLRPMLRALAQTLDVLDAKERRTLTRRIDTLLGQDEQNAVPLEALLRTTGPYWERLVPSVREQLRDPATLALLAHCSSMAGIAPSGAWSARAAALAAEVPAPADVLAGLLTGLFGLPETPGRHEYDPPTWVGEPTETTLRGVLASYAATRGDDAAELLTEIAVAAGTGFGGSGGVCRSTRLTNTAVALLARLDGEPAVAGLARARSTVKNKTVLKGVTKALEAASERAGITPDQLLERVVPTHGLTGVGQLDRPVGRHTARIFVTATTAALTFATADGKALKGVPAAVKTDHQDELAELKRTVADLRKALPVQRLRVEDLLATGRTWTGQEWTDLYLDHPLTGVFTRSLIWEVTEDPAEGSDSSSSAWTAGWLDEHDALRALDGTDLEASRATAVRLWHPALAATEQVRLWREHLTDREVRQPFKQAFREVYLLTPAEVTTGSYSNRYAAHIVRYGQFGALLRARGWSGSHLGYWDGGYEGSASKDYGTWRAEIFYDLAETDAPEYELSPPYASTDQLRFHRREGSRWEPVRVDAVPPLVLTEAMRDADLFVGVTSIAADPAWTDGGETRIRDYWQRESFGDLTESAQTRREALLRLMPRTKIAARVTVTDRFLVVRGDLRTYRIHLGSGNILMEPNDAYLCIVVARGSAGPQATGSVFLPFEEDGGLLSVIVSKAFLLANDTAITDATIVAQLRH